MRRAGWKRMSEVYKEMSEVYKEWVKRQRRILCDFCYSSFEKELKEGDYVVGYDVIYLKLQEDQNKCECLPERRKEN